LATLGVVIPSFIVISTLSFFILEFKELLWVNAAFMGIRAGVAILILNAVFKLSKNVKKSVLTYVLAAFAFVIALLTDFSVILLLLMGAILGIIYGYVSLRKMGGITHD
jgi:chromate transporter